MERRPRAWLAAALAGLLALSGGTAGARAQDNPAESLAQYQSLDRVLQDTGWQLVTGNAPFCENAIPSVGLQLQDMRGYGDPDAVRSALGLSGDFAVATVAAGSPAEAAGLSRNEGVLRIAGQVADDWPAEAKGDWRRLKRAHDLIDAELAENGFVTLTLADGGDVKISATQVCPTRFELLGDSERALAEGERVLFGTGFPAFGYRADEFAAAVAHELAHNLLRHRAWLDAEGRKRTNVRLTEREADRLMPWLLANAGYEPAAALRFMQKWGPRHSGGILRKRTHDGWDERAEMIAAEIALVGSHQSNAAGKADWSTNFRRETGR